MSQYCITRWHLSSVVDCKPRPHQQQCPSNIVEWYKISAAEVSGCFGSIPLLPKCLADEVSVMYVLQNVYVYVMCEMLRRQN